MAKLDERLFGKKRSKQSEGSKQINTPAQPRIVYTARQLAAAMPGLSYKRVLTLIAEGKIRTIPAGVWNARWEVIPYNTLMEDLSKLVTGGSK